MDVQTQGRRKVRGPAAPLEGSGLAPPFTEEEAGPWDWAGRGRGLWRRGAGTPSVWRGLWPGSPSLLDWVPAPLASTEDGGNRGREPKPRTLQMQAEDRSLPRPLLEAKQTRVPSSSGSCLKAARARASGAQRVEPAADAQTSWERKTCSSKAPQAVAILFLKSTFIKQEISSLSHSIFSLFLCVVHLRRLSYISLPFSETLHSAEYMYSYDKPRQYIKKQRHHYSQSYGFSSSLMWLWELDHKEDWALRNWCLWTVVLEKTLESPLDYKEIKPANLKGNQPWIFIRSSDVETPVLWPPDAKNQVIEKDPDAGKDWRREEKEMTEDEMVGWHHWLNGHEFEQALRVGEGQGSLVCCSTWCCKESDTTDWLNNNIKRVLHWSKSWEKLKFISPKVFFPLPKLETMPAPLHIQFL